jgi:hypothetical protein
LKDTEKEIIFNKFEKNGQTMTSRLINNNDGSDCDDNSENNWNSFTDNTDLNILKGDPSYMNYTEYNDNYSDNESYDDNGDNNDSDNERNEKNDDENKKKNEKIKKNENENFHDILDEIHMGDIDEWNNDDDAGYIYVPMSEADFFEMVEEVGLYIYIHIYTCISKCIFTHI